jgi:hypothetical protein
MLEPVCLLQLAPVAQLDRVSGFEPGGREFESLRARQCILKIRLLKKKTSHSALTNVFRNVLKDPLWVEKI